ncbi:hypothetical protein CH63R_14601 [Colletotrichum higginsianum IMI 349063]|uniref:Uncharacterized protein n=1 Tax=Colletotrichum higginsianum (strain IMI 349063) TaxID=759273 RepID=A0A1B7XQJ4_COLHI|nr:hypothetical protein CH63R_14601 [Colletotrichum higginsianum IMI 349063]OBR02029.1 hypothetical protein CH63R_14601 [Colletotrichum higginsianum IMI 349063]
MPGRQAAWLPYQPCLSSSIRSAPLESATTRPSLKQVPGNPYFVNPGYNASSQSTVPKHEPNLETVHLIAAEPFLNELKLATSLSKPVGFSIGLTPDKKYWEVAAYPGLLTSQDV